MNEDEASRKIQKAFKGYHARKKSQTKQVPFTSEPSSHSPRTSRNSGSKKDSDQKTATEDKQRSQLVSNKDARGSGLQKDSEVTEPIPQTIHDTSKASSVDTENMSIVKGKKQKRRNCFCF
jgi:hypothetical protein